jgi:small subunit ribosomal protein S4
MTKIVQAKHKIDRRLGVNLWGRPKSPMNTRKTRPGQHGQQQPKRSDYGTQLLAKQKLRGYYGRINERQFRRFFAEASRRRGDTSENLINLLERRVDALVYRAKIAPTIFAARQLVSHGHIQINGKKITIPSQLMEEGDILTVRQKSRTLPLILESLVSPERELPDYIAVDDGGYRVIITRSPKLSDVPYPVQMEPGLVTEFYSR